MNVLAASCAQAVAVDARIVPQQGSVNCQRRQVRVVDTELSPARGSRANTGSLGVALYGSHAGAGTRSKDLEALFVVGFDDLQDFMRTKWSAGSDYSKIGCTRAIQRDTMSPGPMSQQITKSFANLSLAFCARHLLAWSRASGS